ncbi:MAG: NUDIX domain-containing protein [Chloroflexi bacterium]|nr:MAG: NUDIX domain-containing protein [Chloroflexota bacterium]
MPTEACSEPASPSAPPYSRRTNHHHLDRHHHHRDVSSTSVRHDHHHRCPKSRRRSCIIDAKGLSGRRGASWRTQPVAARSCSPVARVHQIVSAVVPWDDREAEQKADILDWLATEDDVFRRVRPATPPRHLVSYVVLVDAARQSMLLVEHRDAGRHLPAGGHVDPGEDPAVTALREAGEELDIAASFLPGIGARPLHSGDDCRRLGRAHRRQPLVRAERRRGRAGRG